MDERCSRVSTFKLHIKKLGFLSYQLNTSQIAAISQERAFDFFKNPQNLCHITPDWLDFRMLNKDSNTAVYENSEFEYTIKWLGIRMAWRSRIIDFDPPERFTDIQIKGPYKSWVHLHTLESVPEGTLMKDQVTYQIPLIAIPLHALAIKKQLENIFCYRASKIVEWAEKEKIYV